MNSSDEEKEAWREDKDFLMMLRLTPEKVKDWGMDGDHDEKMMGEKGEMGDKKPEGKGPPKLIKLLRF